jgi:hypothetical protein
MGRQRTSISGIFNDLNRFQRVWLNREKVLTTTVIIGRGQFSDLSNLSSWIRRVDPSLYVGNFRLASVSLPQFDKFLETEFPVLDKLAHLISWLLVKKHQHLKV